MTREEARQWLCHRDRADECFDLIDAIYDDFEMKSKALIVKVPNEYTNINQNAFNEWMAYKKYKNKGAITKTLNMLNKYDFKTQQEMVDKSIMNEYKGLFEPKQKRSNTENNINAAKSWIEKNDFQDVEEISYVR